jgi:hypothetical protein
MTHRDSIIAFHNDVNTTNNDINQHTSSKQSPLVIEGLKRKSVLKFVQESSWIVDEKDRLWESSDNAWHCRKCALQFSLFQRKHHCRRCGGIFCNEHAPMLDLATTLPSGYKEV